VWRPEQTEPIQLIAGGSGIVPLMAMIRSRGLAKSTAPFRLLYSVREPGVVFYYDELRKRSQESRSLTLTFAYTRATPKDWPRPPSRIEASLVAEAAWPSKLAPACYVCGPTPFVESVAGFLSAGGNGTDKIKAERFGPTGGRK
jgi:ferredoxin-NADP reductase